MKRLRTSAWAVWLVLGIAACGAESDNTGNGTTKGSSGMWSLFNGKKDGGLQTQVHADVGAALEAGKRFPDAAAAQANAAATAAFGSCTEVAVEGTPPAARFAAQARPGETARGFRIDTGAGLPPLLLLNVSKGGPHVEGWELAAGASPAFVRQRPLALDPAQSQWAGYLVEQVACLPQQRQLLALYYAQPAARQGLYLHDARSGRFTRIAERIERDQWQGLPPRYLDLLPAGRDAMLVLYHSDAQRLAAEVNVNRLDHVLLFSPRHPQGLEVLTLAVDKGNLRRWAMVGSTLWIEAVDPRERGKPLTYIWSLDLARVL